MQDQPSDILERLKHPEEENQRPKVPNNLYLRNILNLLFIVMALITMGCIGMYWDADETPMWCYLLGVIAVIIKMCESLLRMPGLHKSSGPRTHRRYGR